MDSSSSPSRTPLKKIAGSPSPRLRPIDDDLISNFSKKKLVSFYADKAQRADEKRYNKLSDRIAKHYSPNAAHLTLRSIRTYQGMKTITSATKTRRAGIQSVFRGGSPSPIRVMKSRPAIDGLRRRRPFDPQSWAPESADIDPLNPVHTKNSDDEDDDAPTKSLEDEVFDAVEKHMDTLTGLQREADFAMRKETVRRALERVVPPQNEHQFGMLRSMLQRLSNEYVVASCRATVEYKRLRPKVERTSLNLIRERSENERKKLEALERLYEKQVLSPQKSRKFVVLRKTGVGRGFVKRLTLKLRDTLCITEPLMLRLELIWQRQARSSFDDMGDNKEFLNSLPTMANRFRHHVYEYAGETREKLIRYWIPEAIVTTLESVCAYLEVLDAASNGQKGVGSGATKGPSTLDNLRGKSRVFSLQAVIRDPTILVRDLDTSTVKAVCGGETRRWETPTRK